MLSTTGMWLAEHSEQTTIVSRDPSDFVNKIRNRGWFAKDIACDYTNPHQRQNLLNATIQDNSPKQMPPEYKQGTLQSRYDLILAWLHQNPVPFLESLSLNCATRNARIIWVVGSGFDNPAKSPALPNIISTQTLEIAVLGFQMKDGKSRWLSHDEISQGTISAIKTQQHEKVIIGKTNPWFARP
ncbi:hypothetical protein [uncultured Kiloniella sp.]|uniref:hypothetical protein n=1 Tax=uncultured Kiloniella sp. TaxID=1133091 RepID=UPI00260FCED7|nr:hypothetical protein [uncultured Kiloniella sp.]